MSCEQVEVDLDRLRRRSLAATWLLFGSFSAAFMAAFISVLRASGWPEENLSRDGEFNYTHKFFPKDIFFFPYENEPMSGIHELFLFINSRIHI